MIQILVVSSPSPSVPDLPADLSGAGLHVLGACSCDNLVREAVRHAPDAIVCWEPSPSPAFFQALRLLRESFPLPVLVFTADVQAESMERALDEGVAGWVVNGYAASRLRPLVQLALARHRRERAREEALQDVTARFEERKVVDRAKGLLMRALQVPEDEAFGLLRAASMQAKQRVGQVAQQLVEAARDAGLVNRAGQLRMLSQRAVKLSALAAAGVEPSSARALLSQTLARCEEQLGQLRTSLSGPTFGDLLAPALSAWEDLRQSLASGRADLQAVDRAAEDLLVRADRLTSALEAAGPAPSLRIVNLCGRQRMLSQRLAKQALLATLLPAEPAGSAARGAEQTVAEFEAALRELQEAPIGTPEIRAGLLGAGEQWQRMKAGAADAGSPAGRLALAAASESLLSVFEDLTGRYERSVESLVG